MRIVHCAVGFLPTGSGYGSVQRRFARMLVCERYFRESMITVGGSHPVTTTHIAMFLCL